MPEQLASQQLAAEEAARFVATFNAVILFPTIALLTGIAFLVFLWGTAQYFMNAANDQGRQQGVKHMTWGIIGLVIMISAYSILTLATGTFGLNKQLECADNPSAGGCEGVFQIPSQSGGSGGGNTGGSGGGNTGGAGGSN